MEFIKCSRLPDEYGQRESTASALPLYKEENQVALTVLQIIERTSLEGRKGENRAHCVS